MVSNLNPLSVGFCIDIDPNLSYSKVNGLETSKQVGDINRLLTSQSSILREAID